MKTEKLIKKAKQLLKELVFDKIKYSKEVRKRNLLVKIQQKARRQRNKKRRIY